MKSVLNETTNTVHRHKRGASEFATECGLIHSVAPEQLRKIPLKQAIDGEKTTKCGRCFPGTGGY